MELTYGFLVIAGLLSAGLFAYVVGTILLAGWVAAALAAFGGFVVGLSLTRRLIVGPAKRRARIRIATIDRADLARVGPDLAEWPLLASVWPESTTQAEPD